MNEDQPTMTAEELAQLDDISRNNVIIQRMVAESLPFDRATYVGIFYAGQVPKPWTHDHEAILPPVFRDENADEVRRAIQALGDAIGVTYTGDVPR
jgi:hypothetical protein